MLVTGASRGIGEAIARAFAARGCTLGLVARRSEPLEKLAAELPGSDHAAIPADVTDSDSMTRAVEQFGDVDVLVANAGITHYRPFAQLPLDEARQMNDVNWLGTIHTVWAGLPGMLERGRGHIVVVSSGGGVRGFPSAAVYNGTKAAQRSFAEALRHELDGSGVSVTTVYPGEIETSLHDHELDHMPDWYRTRSAGAGRSPRGAGGAGGRDRPPRALLPADRALAANRERHLAPARRPHAATDPRQERRAAMSLPLKPPVKPQLARSAKELPEGEGWRYEPKFDGFRTIVFRDGDDVQLQSRNGKPMNRYFPDIVEQVLELPHDRLVLDGEMMVVVDGVQEFDLLSQRIHPAASRVERLRAGDTRLAGGLRPAGGGRRGAVRAALRRAPRAA